MIKILLYSIYTKGQKVGNRRYERCILTRSKGVEEYPPKEVYSSYLPY